MPPTGDAVISTMPWLARCRLSATPPTSDAVNTRRREMRRKMGKPFLISYTIYKLIAILSSDSWRTIVMYQLLGEETEKPFGCKMVLFNTNKLYEP